MRVRAVKNDTLLILDIIFSFTQITSRREGPGVPCHSLTMEGVDTQSKTGNTANDISWEVKCIRGYKDGLQPESLADGNWLVKQKQPVSKIETKSDTNLRSLYES